MPWQYSDFTIYTIINSIISFGIAFYSLGRSNIRNTKSFFVLMFSVGIWSFASTMELIANLPSEKIFWSKFSYLGISTIGPAWLWFSFSFTGLLKRISKIALIICYSISLLITILAFTNEFHGLIWTSTLPVINSHGLVIHYNHGPVVIFNAVYTYLLYFLGFSLFIVRAVEKSSDFQWNAVIFGFAGLIPVLTNIWYMNSQSELSLFDLTPVSFTITGIIIYFGLLRFHILSFLPIAYQTLFENMKDAVLVIDQYKKVRAVNPAVYQLIEIKNKENQSINKIPVDFLHSLKEFILSGQSEKEAELLLPNQTKKHIHLLLSVIQEGKNKFNYLIVIRDITQRKETEKALTINMQKVEELAQSQNKLLGIISHDFKNSVSNIENATNLILFDETISDEDKNKVLKEINNNSKTTTNLLENVLEWARAKNTVFFNPSNLPCKELIEEVISSLRFELTNKKITVDLSVEEGLRVFTDKNIFSTIIRNLLSNAVKFSYERGRIEFHAYSKENQTIICIKDFGTGINEKLKENLFEIKGKTSNPGTRNEKGSGFGLFLCKELVELHHGQIRVESTEGSGSTFIIELPDESIYRLSVNQA